jgi:hypothetical protein
VNLRSSNRSEREKDLSAAGGSYAQGFERFAGRLHTRDVGIRKYLTALNGMFRKADLGKDTHMARPHTPLHNFCALLWLWRNKCQ